MASRSFIHADSRRARFPNVHVFLARRRHAEGGGFPPVSSCACCGIVAATVPWYHSLDTRVYNGSLLFPPASLPLVDRPRLSTTLVQQVET